MTRTIRAGAGTALVRRSVEQGAKREAIFGDAFTRIPCSTRLGPTRKALRDSIRFLIALSRAFSEIHIDIDDTMVDGDKICVRWSFSGKHTGDGLNISPTDMTVHTTGITIMRVAGGKLIEGWQNWDMLGMMQQIQGSHKALTYASAPPHIFGDQCRLITILDVWILDTRTNFSLRCVLLKPTRR